MLHNDTRCSIHMFAMAADAGVKQLIYTSSTAAMGEFRPGMHEEMKLKPTDFYGATKAATEAYLLAFGSKTNMRCNIVRPGFTIGNPVVPGASIYSDKRFKEIVKNALTGEDIRVTKHDGTQFVWAGDLAKIYAAILTANVNRGVYFGLSQDFTTWEAIARQVLEMTGSKSRLIVEDKDWGADPYLFDLSKIKREFGLAFDSTQIITDHLRYLIGELKK
jgi:UDP-glucose 4-epimerase